MENTKTAEEILFHRMVTEPSGFHDEVGYKEQMRAGYGDQICEAMQEYSDQNTAPLKKRIEELQAENKRLYQIIDLHKPF